MDQEGCVCGPCQAGPGQSRGLPTFQKRVGKEAAGASVDPSAVREACVCVSHWRTGQEVPDGELSPEPELSSKRGTQLSAGSTVRQTKMGVLRTTRMDYHQSQPMSNHQLLTRIHLLLLLVAPETSLEARPRPLSRIHPAVRYQRCLNRN
uniref:Uncharacterized protein n=1 Tax=Knipowitschia caucasica TaxID=637954 RepID=A0AAV2L175_KNICA